MSKHTISGGDEKFLEQVALILADDARLGELAASGKRKQFNERIRDMMPSALASATKQNHELLDTLNAASERATKIVIDTMGRSVYRRIHA